MLHVIVTSTYTSYGRYNFLFHWQKKKHVYNVFKYSDEVILCFDLAKKKYVLGAALTYLPLDLFKTVEIIDICIRENFNWLSSY